MVLKACKGDLNTGNTIRKGVRAAVDACREYSIECYKYPDYLDVQWFLKDLFAEAEKSADYIIWDIYHQAALLAQLQEDMFDVHGPGVTLSLNKDHRWTWPELLKNSLSELRRLRTDASKWERWSIPEFYYREEHCLTSAVMDRISGIDRSHQSLEYASYDARTSRFESANRFQHGSRGMQRKQNLVSKHDWRNAILDSVEEEELRERDKYYERISVRPEYEYLVTRDDIQPKLYSNYAADLFGNSGPEDGYYKRVKRKRKAKCKAKGVKNKVTHSGRDGLTHGQMRHTSAEEMGIPRSSYTYKHWILLSKGRDTYVPKNTSTKLTMIAAKPEIRADSPRRHVGTDPASERAPHPPPARRGRGGYRGRGRGRRGGRGRSRPIPEEYYGDSSSLTVTTASVDNSQSSTTQGNHLNRVNDNDAAATFITEARSESFRIDSARFRALPPILPSTPVATARKHLQVTSPDNVSEKPREEKRIQMWQFAEECFSSETQQLKTGVFFACDSEWETPCLSRDGEQTTQSLPSIIPTTSDPSPGKQIGCETRKNDNGTLKKKKNNHGKRRRDRIKRRKLAEMGVDVDKQIKGKAEDEECIIPYVIAKLKTESTQTQKLLNRYGASLKESPTSVPYKFAIDVSNSVFEDEGELKIEKAQKAIAVLLFEKVTPAESHKQTQDSSFTTYRIYPQCDLPAQEEQDAVDAFGEKVKFHLIYPCRKVVAYFVDILKDTLNKGSLKCNRELGRKHCLVVDDRMLNKMEWLYSICDWNYTVHTAQEAYANVKQNRDMQRPTSAQLRKADLSAKGLSCNRCYKPLPLPKSSAMFEDLLQSRSITMLPCLHSFCANCFRVKLENTVKRKEVPIFCPGNECNTIIDPVTIQWGLSLQSYNKHCKQMHDTKVKEHPQWQWCPNEKCGRAVKLHGSALLESSVVIQCLCGSLWCFHCQQRGHWPASCEHAKVYTELQNLDKQTQISTVTRLVCPEGHIEDDSSNRLLPVAEILEAHKTENFDSCTCTFEFCVRCNDVENSVVRIPERLIEQKVVCLVMAEENLLPLILYRCARNHGLLRQSWSQTNADLKANTIIRQIQRSRSNLRSSIGGRILIQSSNPLGSAITPHPPEKLTCKIPTTAASWGGISNPGKSGHGVKFTPSIETERIFLILVQQFLFQCHYLLENIYVILFIRFQKNKPSDTVTTLVLKLEKTMDSIQMILDSASGNSSSQHVLRLKKLMDHGKKLMMDLVRSVKGFSRGDTKRMDTVLPIAHLSPEVTMLKPLPSLNIRSITKL